MDDLDESRMIAWNGGDYPEFLRISGWWISVIQTRWKLLEMKDMKIY